MTPKENGFSRRLILQGAGLVALVGLGNVPFLAPAFARPTTNIRKRRSSKRATPTRSKLLYGKTAEPSDKVKLDAPEIAENGAVVRCRSPRRSPT